MSYQDCLETAHGIIAEQVFKLRAEKPEATSDELREIVIKAMRPALVIRGEEVEDWAKGKEMNAEKGVNLILICMVAMFRADFGVDTTDPVAQESLMAEVQKALDSCLP
jgi:hypothetical protein